MHNLKNIDVDIPLNKVVGIAGVSGSGKTTMILESLIPAVEAMTAGQKLPGHVKKVTAEGIRRIRLIDATPIGINVRSTVAAYADVHNELRKAYARTADAKSRGHKAGDFSRNTGKLRCLVCDGTGFVSLDVQFLPDVDVPCPDCEDSRYAKEAYLIRRISKKGGRAYSLPELMELSVDEALAACGDLPNVRRKLEVLHDLGLGYLTLGEETPSLSGVKAQRLKLPAGGLQKSAGCAAIRARRSLKTDG